MEKSTFEKADGFGKIAAYDAPDELPVTGARAFLLASSTLWQREMVRFFRQPSRVMGALLTPILFWLLVGSGLGRSFRPADVTAGVVAPDYLQFFFAGSMLLILLFTAVFSTFSLIQDKKDGFLQGVLVAPIPRGALVLGKVLGGATLAVLQAMLFLAIAPLAGILVGAETGFLIAGAGFLIAFALTGLGLLVAWPMESIQGFHAVLNLLLMPMWLLSGALFPASGASVWIKVLMAINPLAYGLTLLRAALNPASVTRVDLALALGVTFAFAAVTFLAAWLMVCRGRKAPL